MKPITAQRVASILRRSGFTAAEYYWQPNSVKTTKYGVFTIAVRCVTGVNSPPMAPRVQQALSAAGIESRIDDYSQVIVNTGATL
jgi:hypothetical protein